MWGRARAAIAILVAILVAILGASACGGSPSSHSATNGTRAPAVTVTVNQLRAIAKAGGHPLYWIGPPPPGTALELTRIADGRIYLRYLPPGTPTGTGDRHLTIGTYAQPGAPLPAVRAAAQARHAQVRSLPNGALAVQYRNYPQSVYMVFPGAHYVVEVYDPSPAKSLRLATGGQVVPVS